MPSRTPARSRMTPEDRELWEVLCALSRGVFRHLQQDLRRSGLTVPQFWVLRGVSHHGPIPCGKLSAWLDVTLPTVTGIVDHLEGLDLVSRHPSPNDRRQVLIDLTPKGANTLRDLHLAPTGFDLPFSEILAPRERELLLRALGRLTESLTPEHGPCDGGCCARASRS
jgi:DNA-binding MarR family transcriptional regulator